MQLAAKSYLAWDKEEEAQSHYAKENALTRELTQNGVHNADRFLVASLISQAANLDEVNPVERTIQLFAEALQILIKRLQGDDVVGEDFWMLKRLCKKYLGFLRDKDRHDEARRIANAVLVFFESAKVFPKTGVWMEASMVLEVCVTHGCSPEELQEVYKRHRKLLRKHPGFKTDKGLKAYDRLLKKRLDELKNPPTPAETTEM
jgi:hypothetical protein